MSWENLINKRETAEGLKILLTIISKNVDSLKPFTSDHVGETLEDVAMTLRLIESDLKNAIGKAERLQ